MDGSATERCAFCGDTTEGDNGALPLVRATEEDFVETPPRRFTDTDGTDGEGA